MIIKRFQEQVESFPGKIAIKTGERILTYSELNAHANRVANAIKTVNIRQEEGGDTRITALLFQHGADMIVGVLGALKANRVYVPLDTSYPPNRLVYMLNDSGSGLILTNNKNVALAEQLVQQSRRQVYMLNIDHVGEKFQGDNINREISLHQVAYILYTSGSTAQPKGVYQTHRNVMYYTRNWIERFSITGVDRMSLFTAFSHDGSVQDMFAALLAGASLYPYSIQTSANMDEIFTLLKEEKLTIWHSVPSLFRYFASTLARNDRFPGIRWILLGGEPLRAHDLTLFKTHFPGAQLANVYGQTESSVSSICTISQEGSFDDISIGQPLDETEILLVDKDGQLVEGMGVGEVVTACDYIAPGYWKNEKAAEQVFKTDEELGRLYFTGDMGRLSPNGSIKIIGRKDLQVKVRGFRVELGAIETVLLRHKAVKEVAAAARPGENGDNYLCVYYLSDETLSPDELREFIAGELPAYMIPRYFIPLETMPLTPNGKIDRKSLPEPGEAIILEPGYEAPADETEQKLAEIWQDLLEVEKVGIHENFIQLGGHSLLGISLISRVHQVFDVELQMNDVFENPTIRSLARYIENLDKTRFISINAVEKKEYYSLSSAQRRLYIIHRMEPESISYNISQFFILEGELEGKKSEEIFKTLIKRYESFRTSFELIDQQPMQRIHHEVAFEKETEALSGLSPADMIKVFVRPFDLSQAPLLRVRLIKQEDARDFLMIDMHHIISDDISIQILVNDFIALYRGDQLPPLKLQYKDYSQWQKDMGESAAMKRQADYWLKVFEGEIPVLDLPTDYPRPLVQRFEGRWIKSEINETLTGQLKAIAAAQGVTLYMVLLAIFTILLAKYTGQTDIIVGTPVAGRGHADLEQIIGMFVNVLLMRNTIDAKKNFAEFLEDVKYNTLQAFNNQDYSIDSLAEKLDLKRDAGRNPLYEVIFVLVNRETRTLTIPDLELKPVEYASGTIKTDLRLGVEEKNNKMEMMFSYSTTLFKRETAEDMLRYYHEILNQVAADKNIKLADIKLSYDLVYARPNTGRQKRKEFNI